MAADQSQWYPASLQAVLDTMADTTRLEQIADFMVTCGGREWKLHRFVLFMHSPVFAIACSKDFEEVGKRSMDLPDDDPNCVAAMVNFFYKLNYDMSFFSDRDCPLAVHVKMCILADKYCVTTLQDLAVDKFIRCLTDDDWPEEKMTDAARLAYDALGPTKEVRAAIVRRAVEDELFVPRSYGASRPFERFMRECAPLATDLVSAVWFARPNVETQASLVKCDSTFCVENYLVWARVLSKDSKCTTDPIRRSVGIICNGCDDVMHIQSK